MAELSIDLVRKAILSRYTGDFAWVDDKTALRVGSDPQNCGFTAPAIRELVMSWVVGGGEIEGGREERENWRHKRSYVYWVVLQGIDEFPKGFFVEMELTDDDPEDPLVSLVNAHPASYS